MRRRRLAYIISYHSPLKVRNKLAGVIDVPGYLLVGRCEGSSYIMAVEHLAGDIMNQLHRVLVPDGRSVIGRVGSEREREREREREYDQSHEQTDRR